MNAQPRWPDLALALWLVCLHAPAPAPRGSQATPQRAFPDTPPQTAGGVPAFVGPFLVLLFFTPRRQLTCLLSHPSLRPLYPRTAGPLPGLYPQSLEQYLVLANLFDKYCHFRAYFMS